MIYSCYTFSGLLQCGFSTTGLFVAWFMEMGNHQFHENYLMDNELLPLPPGMCTWTIIQKCQILHHGIFIDSQITSNKRMGSHGLRHKEILFECIGSG
jgi:hypothetical protein